MINDYFLLAGPGFSEKYNRALANRSPILINSSANMNDRKTESRERGDTCNPRMNVISPQNSIVEQC
jgi:hypothetical protein